MRVAVVNDFREEGRETFRLVATNTGGGNATGTGTIADDGSVPDVFNADNTSGNPTAGVADDDRPRPPPPRDVGSARSARGEVLGGSDLGLATFGTGARAAPGAAAAFDSALLVTRASTLPMPTPGQVEALMTRESGFRVVVLDTRTPGPSVFRGMGDLSVNAGQRTEIAVSSESFTHPQSDAVISLAARLANGGTLPAWVRFDADRGTFVVTAPPGLRGTLEIVLIARDQTGREATTTFKLRVDATPEAAAGRAGLSEQLRAAGQRPGALSALLRPASPAERPTPTPTDTAAGGPPTPRPAVPARAPAEATLPVRQAPAEPARPAQAADRPADRPSFAAKQRPQR